MQRQIGEVKKKDICNDHRARRKNTKKKSKRRTTIVFLFNFRPLAFPALMVLLAVFTVVVTGDCPEYVEVSPRSALQRFACVLGPTLE